MALVVTVGGASSTSYADADFAGQYFASTGRQAEWELVANDADKWLFDAMAFMERPGYVGMRAATTQALEFPRKYGVRQDENDSVTAETLTDLLGRTWAVTAIPTPVKQAQCEQAFALSQNKAYTENRYTRQTVSAGGTELSVATVKDLDLCPQAARLLAPFLSRGVGVRASYR